VSAREKNVWDETIFTFPMTPLT